MFIANYYFVCCFCRSTGASFSRKTPSSVDLHKFLDPHEKKDEEWKTFEAAGARAHEMFVCQWLRWDNEKLLRGEKKSQKMQIDLWLERDLCATHRNILQWLKFLSRALDGFFYFCESDKRSLIISEEEEKKLISSRISALVVFVSFSGWHRPMKIKEIVKYFAE